MFSLIFGIALGLGIGWVCWADGRTIQVRAVDQRGSVAGGDIVGGDKEAGKIIDDLKHQRGR